MFNRFTPHVYIFLALAVVVLGVEAWKWAVS
jgi:hypothetical protein